MTDVASIATVSPSKRRAALRPLLRILPYALRYKGRILGALVSLTLASAATLVVPVAIRRIMDFGFSRGSTGLVNSYFVAMVAVVAVLAAASGAPLLLRHDVGASGSSPTLRADVFAHLCRLDAVFYDTARTGELVSRLTADTTQMKSAFGSSASLALRNLFPLRRRGRTDDRRDEASCNRPPRSSAPPCCETSTRRPRVCTV